LHLFSILNLLSIRVAPFDRNFAIGIGVDKHVECAVAVELRQECNRRSYLSENSGDFGLDLGLCFLRGCRRGSCGRGVFLVFGG
jgi:hypothetical protein